MGRLIEVTFMSLDGVTDAPDVVQEAQRYFAFSEDHDAYQRERLDAADALLLGRKTSEAYLAMAESGQGAAPFVDRHEPHTQVRGNWDPRQCIVERDNPSPRHRGRG